MKTVEKFFGLKAGETQVCNGFRFDCVKKEVLTQGAAPTLFGTFTAPDGSVTDYTEKGVFANKLNKLAGVANKAVFKSKVDNSQQTGDNKVVYASMSASKQQKRFMKAWRSMLQVHRVYCPEATDIPSLMWEALITEDAWYNKVERIKAQQAVEAAKAEAEAKAKAEAEAKAEADRMEAQRKMIELAAKNAGISIEQAEQNLRVLGMIK